MAQRYNSPKAKETYVYLRGLAGALQVGETQRLICPFCEGGRSREHSFSLSRTSDAECLYNCYRATCGYSGRLACPGFRLTGPDNSSDTKRARRAASIKVFSGAVQPMGVSWLSKLASVYGISEEETSWAKWGEAVDDGSLVVPIVGPQSIPRGILLRSTDIQFPGSRTHSKLYPSTDEPRQGWCRRDTVREVPVVLVEDVISALKVSRQYTTVALLGTTLSEDKLDEILGISKSIVIALDNDATDKSYAYQKKFGLLGDIRVAVLEVDLKYETDERIKYIIESAL